MELRRATQPFVYKYGNFDYPERLKEVLLQHRAYFPTPPELNDPVDVRPPLRFASEQAYRDLMVNTYVQNHSGMSFDVLAAEVAIIHSLWHTVGEAKLIEMCQKQFHCNNATYRVYSLGSSYDNAHLWKRYARNGTGYCLEFENGSEPFIGATFVEYLTEVTCVIGENRIPDWAFLFRKTTA